MDMVAGLCLTLVLYFQGGAKQYLRTFLWVVTASAGMIILASVTGLELQGRSEVAELYRVGGGVLTESASGSVRYLTSASVPALLVLCGGVSWLMLKRRLDRTASLALFAAVVVCFMSYSRYQILALCSAIIFALIVIAIRCDLMAVPRFVGKLILCTFLVGGIIIPLVSSTSIYAGLQGQFATYSTRVLSGLNPGVRANDSSTQDRVEENTLMSRAIGSSPLLGHGFGYAYKPARGPASQFAANGGQYYGHNFYLWITMKAGLLGGLSFLGLIVAGVAASLRRSYANTESAIVGCCLAAIAITMAIAPLINSYPGGLLVGVVLALALINRNLIDYVVVIQGSGEGESSEGKHVGVTAEVGR
jgi:O-antigen ligase